MLIRNYGLFWLRSQVDWSKQGGKNGTLKGKYAKQRRAPEVDFREQRGVYVLYDDNFEIIYVGQAGAGQQRLLSRLRKHKRDHLAQRWSKFSWFGILPVKNGKLRANARLSRLDIPGVLDHMEAILLAAAEPPLNLQRGRFGEEVEQYLQHSPIEDEEEVGDEEEDA